MQIIICDIPHYRMKNKNYMIISMDVGKAFDKIQYTFVIKSLNKLDMEGVYLNIIKAILISPQLTYSPVKSWKLFFWRSVTRQGCQLLSLLFTIILEVITRSVRHEKDRKDIQMGKDGVKLSLFEDYIILYI